jgi:hypothetical protein
LGDEDDEDVQDFYLVPLRSHATANGTLSSVSDFVNAPGRVRKSKTKSISRNGSRAGSRNGEARVRDEEEVLFDTSGSMGVQSKDDTAETADSTGGQRIGH